MEMLAMLKKSTLKQWLSWTLSNKVKNAQSSGIKSKHTQMFGINKLMATLITKWVKQQDKCINTTKHAKSNQTPFNPPNPILLQTSKILLKVLSQALKLQQHKEEDSVQQASLQTLLHTETKHSWPQSHASTASTKATYSSIFKDFTTGNKSLTPKPWTELMSDPAFKRHRNWKSFSTVICKAISLLSWLSIPCTLWMKP